MIKLSISSFFKKHLNHFIVNFIIISLINTDFIKERSFKLNLNFLYCFKTHFIF